MEPANDREGHTPQGLKSSRTRAPAGRPYGDARDRTIRRTNGPRGSHESLAENHRRCTGFARFDAEHAHGHTEDAGARGRIHGGLRRVLSGAPRQARSPTDLVDRWRHRGEPWTRATEPLDPSVQDTSISILTKSLETRQPLAALTQWLSDWSPMPPPEAALDALTSPSPTFERDGHTPHRSMDESVDYLRRLSTEHPREPSRMSDRNRGLRRQLRSLSYLRPPVVHGLRKGGDPALAGFAQGTDREPIAPPEPRFVRSVQTDMSTNWPAREGGGRHRAALLSWVSRSRSGEMSTGTQGAWVDQEHDGESAVIICCPGWLHSSAGGRPEDRLEVRVPLQPRTLPGGRSLAGVGHPRSGEVIAEALRRP